MTKKKSSFVQQGFTLVEVMITVAIVAVLAAVAIPAYFEYIEEAAINATLLNLKTMRVSVEDFRLNDNAGLYPNGNFTNANIGAAPPGGAGTGWNPGNMGPVGTPGAKYNYTLQSLPGGYSIFAVDLVSRDGNGNPIWVRCDNNGQTCCFSVHPLTVAPAVPCPPGSF